MTIRFFENDISIQKSWLRYKFMYLNTVFLLTVHKLLKRLLLEIELRILIKHIPAYRK